MGDGATFTGSGENKKTGGREVTFFLCVVGVGEVQLGNPKKRASEILVC